MKIIMIAPKTSTFINFRGDLMKSISEKGNEIVAICPETGYEKILEDLGARCELISLKKNSTTILDNIKYLNNLTKMIKKEKPDKIFAYTIKPVIFGSIAAKRAKVTEMYSMITGLGYVYTAQSFKIKILRIICGIGYKIAFKFNQKVIFQNKDDMNEFIHRKYLKKEKCKLVDGSGVNMEQFKKVSLPKNNIVFLMVSRILKQKGVKEYFESAKIVKEKYPKVQFLYVGAEDNTKDTLNLESLKKEFIDTGIVEYCGESNDIPSYMAKSTVVVLPSYREGLPKTLIEALAVGRPIITTDTPGCREVIKEEKNGFLVPIKNVQILAEKMIYMIEHKNKLNQMAEESYQYCKERFDINIVNKRMLEIMQI